MMKNKGVGYGFKKDTDGEQFGMMRMGGMNENRE